MNFVFAPLTRLILCALLLVQGLAIAETTSPSLRCSAGLSPAEICNAMVGPSTIFKMKGYVGKINPIGGGSEEVMCGADAGICAWASSCSTELGLNYSGSFNCSLACPPGYVQNGNTCSSGPDLDNTKGCPGQCGAGNPINAANGNKFQQETDFAGSGIFPIKFVRSYNSIVKNPKVVSLDWTPFVPDISIQRWDDTLVKKFVGGESNSLIDPMWRHTYDRTIVIQENGFGSIAGMTREDGFAIEFIFSNSQWIPKNGPLPNQLTQTFSGAGVHTGWQYFNRFDELETYDISGRLLTIQNRSGAIQTLHYNTSGLLDMVTDPVGNQLRITYNGKGQINTVTDPGNGIYSYEYNFNGFLSKLSYPDGLSRQYVYQNNENTTALIGILDENDARFATWTYDSKGRAVSSEHAVGLEKVELEINGTTVLEKNNGTVKTSQFQVIKGRSHPINISENCGVNCARSQSNTYDTNSNKTSSTDWNGNLTTYSYDLTRNLETKRVEASGTATARTISTIWHATYRIPVQVNEPLRKTLYTHDANGNVLTKTEQATSDVNGSLGSAAPVVGTPRTWSTTYNSVGQVLTSTGPRTDIIDRTTYTYDTQGNLATITNAAGHLTTLSGYDAQGHVGTITDPNGLVTALTYHPRGWLLSRATTADGITETTGYTYDGVGQMTKVTLPDNSEINYTYDDAHRLTKITDNVGNSINYTLDNVGNRVSESTTDSTGSLSRQITRIYDALSRLQQVTGAAQ